MKLVIFDVDGTLVDSQAHITGAMARAFEGAGLTAPDRAQVLEIVGLSVPEAIAVLAPGQATQAQSHLAQAFKSAYAEMRHDPSTLSPLYPGARDALDALAARDDVMLAVATGNSRRGLAHVIELHGFDRLFQSRQTADGHPSKPHPAMIEACLNETGTERADAVMIGDTVFDMEMAAAARVTGLGVDWGYHDAASLRAARAADVLTRYDDLVPWLDEHWGCV